MILNNKDDYVEDKTIIGDTTSFVSVGELWDNGKFNYNNTKILYKYLTGNASATISNVNSLANSVASSSTMRAKTLSAGTQGGVSYTSKSSSQNIQVTLGGIKWNVVYLSKDKSSNTIATLWMSNCIQSAFSGRSSTEGLFYGYLTTSYGKALFSDFAADWKNTSAGSYPCSMYGTSYIRVVTLNAGGYYATNNSTLSSYVSQNSSSAFAKFTMSSVSNNLTEYIVKPAQVSWQETQTAIGTSNIDANYSRSNEAWGTPSKTNWKSSSYNYSSKSHYTDWKDDYIWLPSNTETGYKDVSDSDGIWDTVSAQRKDFDGTSANITSSIGTVGSSQSNKDIYAYTALRSAAYDTCESIYDITNNDNALDTTMTHRSFGVRPALHLNLTALNNSLKYTVAYNTNGGSGTMSNQTLSFDTSANLTSNTFTRAGYTFAGWATSASRANAGTVDYTNGQSVSNLTTTNGATVTLYAVWTPITYYVKFDKNSGNGTMSNMTFTYGAAKNLTANSFTRTGYTFSGWATSATRANAGTVDYTNSQSVSNLTTTAGATVTLYAVWTPITYYISFNSNGGTGTMTNQTFTYSVSQNLNENIFVRTGYTFAGWATSQARANAGTIDYADKKSILNLSSTEGEVFTFYAVWTANTYYVRFMAHGGIGSMSNEVFTYNVSKNLTSNTFTKTGYTFAGWAANETSANSGVIKYDDGQIVTNLSSVNNDIVNLYAVWIANTYYILFNSNAGVGTMPNQTLTYDTPSNLDLNQYTRTGYTFIGWATSQQDANNEIVDYDDGEQVLNLTSTPNETITLYAVWLRDLIAHYDGVGLYWYTEIGYMPQTRVSETANSLLNSMYNDSLLEKSGKEYNVTKSIKLVGYLYNGKEYCRHNNQWYLVEPVRWRLQGDFIDGQMASGISAVLDKIVYAGAFSASGTTVYDNVICDPFMHSIANNNITLMRLQNFTPTDLSGSYDKIYVATSSEVYNVAGTYRFAFSDLVHDIVLISNYATRTQGSDTGMLRGYNYAGVGINISATQIAGLQFVIKVSDVTCIFEAKE